jgi:hypothetical protein
MANESSSTERAPASPTAPQVREIQQTIEPPSLQPIYTNFARVMGSPEELILDFGLNTDPMGSSNTPVKISERLVMNYFTAKRLWAALGVSLKRQEATFGVLETDVTKRVVTQVPQTPPR